MVNDWKTFQQLIFNKNFNMWEREQFAAKLKNDVAKGKWQAKTVEVQLCQITFFRQKPNQPELIGMELEPVL